MLEILSSIDDFQHVCFIELEKINETIYEYNPHLNYDNKKNYKLNKYGKGPFCKFKIPKGYAGKKGVYLILENGNIQYVGKCENFESRYNAGYGNISPRNCFEGGQNTNCKINGLILSRIKSGSKIELKFFETENYSQIEDFYIQKLKPSWNGQFRFKSS